LIKALSLYRQILCIYSPPQGGLFLEQRPSRGGPVIAAIGLGMVPFMTGASADDKSYLSALALSSIPTKTIRDIKKQLEKKTK
jgi:hypothetical protein